MLENIAKKYIKAIVSDLKKTDIDSFLKELEKIVGLFSIEKFLNIIHSPYIQTPDKQNFLLQLVESKDHRINNFIKLLIENDRLEITPFVCEGLRAYINEKDKVYIGLLYLREKIDSVMLEEIRKKISTRLSIELKIEQVISKIEGIKLVIEDLDIEISFVKENFLNQLKSHILKAV
ncbi:F0F1 ATP synthase subunit delta [Helicobacter sp. 13S00477-4]|uniref:F0F1 ATP synthase subunit delta n=1 Tax=Helicobacter sp. 13S00477-4 TaxID=1905759 RepID=UPI000BA767D2|nr:F0F1 ATP synthase subunit delta [Helicobacter sp. 13S00477-4]PAF52733.1 hypothetical protein BKH44_00685 [Helicobacter sp. 13S00477-4]